VTEIETTGAEPADAVEPGPAPAEDAARSRRRLAVIAAIAVVTLVIFLIAWVAGSYGRVNGKLDDIDAIRRAAAEFGDAALTYDYTNLKPFRDRMSAHATGTFRRELRDGLGGLESLITQLKARSEATVKEVYVGPVEDHAASAIVLADAKVRYGYAAPKTSSDVSIELQLVEVDGAWLIADVSSLDLGRALGTGGAAGASTTTSTTAPNSSK
jgi:hypothetical protein